MGLFEWRAVYSLDEKGKPEEYLDEYGPGGVGRKITAIEQDRLVQFQLIRRKTGLPHIIVEVRPGQRIIHRKRRFTRFILIFGKGTKEQLAELIEKEKAKKIKRRETIWVIGKHENRRGVNIQQVFIVFQDGHVHVLDKWRDDFAPFCAPILEPCEELGMWKVIGECNNCGACCLQVGVAHMLGLDHKCKYIFRKDDKIFCEITQAVDAEDKEFLDLIPEEDIKYWRAECENFPNPSDPGQMPPRYTVPDKCSLEVVWDEG